MTRAMHRRRWLLLAGLLWVIPQSSPAQPSLRGPLPEGQRQFIHEMARQHDKLTREVELTETGYVARTTSDDPDLVTMLHAHVAYMEKRLGSGAMVRRWDPAFVELVEHYDDIEVAIVELDNGIEARVTGATPEAVRVAQNHAQIVSGFVHEGEPAVQRTHERAVVDP